MLLAFAIPVIDRVTVTKEDALCERYYVYSFVKQSWRAGDALNCRFNLYSGLESGDLPDSYIPVVDFIILFIPFRYKNQGIVVSKGSTKWTYRKANFQLND